MKASTFWSGPNNFYRVTSYPETYIQNAEISANGIYTVSLAGNACVGDPAAVVGEVFSLPGVSAGLDEEFCVGVADYTITGFSPEGGLWQGTGVVNSTSGFNTVVSGAGAFPVNYYYTDANGCSAKATKNITVGPLITTGGVQFVCKSDVAVVLTVVSPVGGNWVLDGNTLAGGVFTPSIPGSYIVTYEFNNGSCINTAVKTVTVRDLPIPPAISSNSPVCKGTNLLLTITGVETGTGITYEWLGSEGFSSVVRLPTRFNATESMGGEYKLRIRQNGCKDSDVFATTTVTVNTLPIVDAGTYAPICFGNNLTLTGTPANGTWTGANLVGNVFTPVAYGTKSFTYTYTDLNGCTNRTTTSVIVNPQNTVTILGLSQNNICRPSLINPVFLVADPTAGGGNDINPNFAFQWSKDGILIQGATGQGYTTDVSGNYCVTVTSDCGNVAIDCYNLNIVDVPVYTVSAPASLCLPGGSGQLQVAIANAVANQNYHLTVLQDGIEKYNQTVAGSTFPYNSPVTSAGAFEVRLENASAYNSCKAANQTKTVLGYSPPTIAMATIPSTICFNAAAINLNATPVGGTWSGNGVVGNQFLPGSSPIGVQTITYSVTGANGCGTFAGVSIDVKPALEITQQPSHVGACSGSSASFSVVANGVKTYKWQYLNGANWTNINTSTTAGHSIASTTLSLNGRQYRCMLTG